MTRGERLTLALLGIIALCIFAALYIPAVLVVLRSFFPGPGSSVSWSAFTLDWYVSLAANGDIRAALGNSILVATGAVGASTCAALFLAAFARGAGSLGRRYLEVVIFLPFVLPAIITGLSLLIALHELGVGTGLFTATLGHFVLILAVSYRMISVRLDALPQSQFEASADLGVGPLRTFFWVVLPQLRSAIVTSALLGFTLSFDETLLSFFLLGADTTVPIRLWSMLRVGFTPEVNAFATIMLATTITLTLLGAASLRDRGAR